MFGEKMDSTMQWEDIRPKLEGEAAFEAIPHEYEKVRMFKDFQKDLEETCMHNHGGTKSIKGGADKRKEKKTKKEKRRRKPRYSLIFRPPGFIHEPKLPISPLPDQS